MAVSVRRHTGRISAEGEIDEQTELIMRKSIKRWRFLALKGRPAPVQRKRGLNGQACIHISGFFSLFSSCQGARPCVHLLSGLWRILSADVQQIYSPVMRIFHSKDLLWNSLRVLVTVWWEARGGTAELILPCLSKQSPKKNKRVSMWTIYSQWPFPSFFFLFVAMDRKVETFSYKCIDGEYGLSHICWLSVLCVLSRFMVDTQARVLYWL